MKLYLQPRYSARAAFRYFSKINEPPPPIAATAALQLHRYVPTLIIIIVESRFIYYLYIYIYFFCIFSKIRETKIFTPKGRS